MPALYDASIDRPPRYCDFAAGRTTNVMSSAMPVRDTRWRRPVVNRVRQAVFLELEVSGRSIEKPLSVTIDYCDGRYEIEHEEFRLYGSGRTQAEAVEDFLSYLVADFNYFALAKDDELDPSAKELADKYRALFGIAA